MAETECCGVRKRRGLALRVDGLSVLSWHRRAASLAPSVKGQKHKKERKMSVSDRTLLQRGAVRRDRVSGGEQELFSWRL